MLTRPLWSVLMLACIIQPGAPRFEKRELNAMLLCYYCLPGTLLHRQWLTSVGTCTCLWVDWERFADWGVTPRPSGDEARDFETRDSSERIVENVLRRTRCRQVHADHRLHLDDACGNFDQAQAQGVELRHTPHRMLRHRHAQAPHDPVGAGVQEQPQLVGAGLGA